MIHRKSAAATADAGGGGRLRAALGVACRRRKTLIAAPGQSGNPVSGGFADRRRRPIST
jgi:hypothetical protein